MGYSEGGYRQRPLGNVMYIIYINIPGNFRNIGRSSSDENGLKNEGIWLNQERFYGSLQIFAELLIYLNAVLIFHFAETAIKNCLVSF